MSGAEEKVPEHFGRGGADLDYSKPRADEEVSDLFLEIMAEEKRNKELRASLPPFSGLCRDVHPTCSATQWDIIGDRVKVEIPASGPALMKSDQDGAGDDDDLVDPEFAKNRARYVGISSNDTQQEHHEKTKEEGGGAGAVIGGSQSSGAETELHDPAAAGGAASPGDGTCGGDATTTVPPNQTPLTLHIEALTTSAFDKPIYRTLQLEPGTAHVVHVAPTHPNISHLGSGGEEKKKDYVRVVAISDTHTHHDNLGMLNKGERRRAGAKLPLPTGDILVHTGDFTNTGTKEEVESFVTWFEAQASCCGGRFDHLVVIAGNHEVTLDARSYAKNWRCHGGSSDDMVSTESLIDLLSRDVQASKSGAAPGASGDDRPEKSHRVKHYLQDRGVEIPFHHNTAAAGAAQPFRIYGSPWQPLLGNWAFNLSRNIELRQKWAEILPYVTEGGGAIETVEVPEPFTKKNKTGNDRDDGEAETFQRQVVTKKVKNFDILMTHGPPLGHGDKIWGGEQHCGDACLLDFLTLCQPKVHFCGHVHDDYGVSVAVHPPLQVGGNVLHPGGQTLCVNAASQTDSYGSKLNPPIVVDIPLGVPDHEVRWV